MRSRVLLSAASERASDERDMDAFAISVPRKHDSSPLLFVCRFCCLIGVANFFLSRISARTWFRGDHLATSGCSRYSQPVGQSVDWPVWSGRSPKVLCRTSDLQGHEEEYLVSAQGFRARSQRRTRTRTRSCEVRRLFVFREAQFHSAEIQELEHPSIGLDWTGLEWSIFAHYMYILAEAFTGWMDGCSRPRVSRASIEIFINSLCTSIAMWLHGAFLLFRVCVPEWKASPVCCLLVGR